MNDFQKVYQTYYNLHPDASTLPKNRLYYLHRQWIFPNHIDVMLELVRDFHERFYPAANLDVALYAALLHDAGLVYERTDASPVGHEEHSCEYATKLLTDIGHEAAFIEQVCVAIRATEPAVTPATDEGILVRNADAYSHLSTMHFFAKAHFADNLQDYIEWFDKKLHASLQKLTIPELITEKRPLVEQYEALLNMYYRHKDAERPAQKI